MYIRPFVEVSSIVIQSIINAEQAASLKRQQSLALRLIYGHGISAAKMRLLGDVERLDVRREPASVVFVKKALESARFAHWFLKRATYIYERKN